MSRSRDAKRTALRVVEGMCLGAVLAALLSLVAGLAVALQGEAVLDRFQLAYGEVVRVYFEGGVVGGAVFGLLRPLFYRVVTAAVAGYLSMLPFAVLATLTMGPRLLWSPTPRSYIVVILLEGLVGAGAGALGWYYFVRESRPGVDLTRER